MRTCNTKRVHKGKGRKTHSGYPRLNPSAHDSCCTRAILAFVRRQRYTGTRCSRRREDSIAARLSLCAVLYILTEDGSCNRKEKQVFSLVVVYFRGERFIVLLVGTMKNVEFKDKFLLMQKICCMINNVMCVFILGIGIFKKLVLSCILRVMNQFRYIYIQNDSVSHNCLIIHLYTN